MTHRIAFAIIVTLTLAGAANGGTDDTPRVDVTDTYHGVTVHDPYRWLENAADPKVGAWTGEQNARTQAYMGGLSSRDAIKARLTSLVTRASPAFYGFQVEGGTTFAMFYDPARQQPLLVTLDVAAGPTSRKLVLDPNQIDAQGSTTIDWFRPSPDGKLVALSLSRNGSEVGTLHLYETTTGREAAGPIPRVQAPTAGGAVAWLNDGTGFWYTRYPGEERPKADRFFYQQIYFHKLGSDWRNDPPVLGAKDGLPRVAEIALGRHNSRDLVVAQVQNGDGGEFAHYVLSPAGVVQLTTFKDKIVDVVSSPAGVVFALSRADAPNGKILKLRPPFTPLGLQHADVLVPESGSIVALGASLTVTRTHLLVRDIAGGPSEVRVFDHQGKPQGLLPLPQSASVGEIAALPEGGALYSVRTYLRPRYVMAWNPSSGQAEETKFADKAAYGFDDMEVVRETAISKDGTKIPIDIIRRKGAVLDGNNPAILYGYGGYGISMTPGFLGARTRTWLDGGGIYAIAIIRGGGEFGEPWHLAGNLTHKQNVFDDFAAAARHLIERKYTSPGRLAIFGESNGGLLMGATLTQHPELMRAVVSRVGIYDMLRTELAPNGAFNVTEFGSVKDPEQFKALLAYSPYQHVEPGVRYPAVLLTTGENDGRVDPMQSRKFAAALEAATASGLPVLLRTNSAGHGMGSSRDERIDEDADILAFLYDQLGVRWREGAAPSAMP